MPRNVWMMLTPLDVYGLGPDARLGIAHYLQESPRWRMEGWTHAEPFRGLTQSGRPHPDGILGVIGGAALRREVAEAGIPMVHLMHLPDDDPVAGVYSDDHAVGRLAAEHFAERALHHVAYLGFNDAPYSVARGEGFNSTAQRLGLACEHRTVQRLAEQQSAWDDWVIGFERWVGELPKPFGLLASSDSVARDAILACARAGLRVPHDVAVVGVNNAPLVCTATDPPISSIQLDYERVGYEAAALLDRMMRGDADTERRIRVPPKGIVVRQSSDVLAIDDADVVEFLGYIRQHADQPMSVWDVLHAVPMARRTIENKFRRYLGHSPAREIKRAQIEHAKKLLQTNDWSMTKVAQSSAFGDARTLSIQFKKETGSTPTAYRKRFRST